MRLLLILTTTISLWLPFPIHAQRLPILRTTPTPSTQAPVLESTRYFFAIILVIIAFILGFIYLGWLTKKGVESIGRNPLAAPRITKVLLIGSSLVVFIAITGLGIAFTIFSGNPPPRHSRLETVAPIREVSFTDVSSTVFTTLCLTVTVPFTTTYPKYAQEDTRCTLKFTLDRPKGYFTLTRITQPKNPFWQDPSIVMRQKYPETYTIVEFSHPDYPTSTAFSTPDELTLFLQDPTGIIYTLSFHQMSPGFYSDITSDVVYAIVDSISPPDPTDNTTFSPTQAATSSASQ